MRRPLKMVYKLWAFRRVAWVAYRLTADTDLQQREKRLIRDFATLCRKSFDREAKLMNKEVYEHVSGKPAQFKQWI